MVQSHQNVWHECRMTMQGVALQSMPSFDHKTSGVRSKRAGSRSCGDPSYQRSGMAFRPALG